MNILKSLEGKIITVGSICIIFTSIFLILYTSYSVQTEELSNAKKLLQSESESNVRLLKGLFNKPIQVSKYLTSYIIQSKKENALPSRKSLNILLKEILRNDKDLFGVWASWNPDAVDGSDEEYEGREGSTKKGGYAPYLTKSKTNTISLSPMENYLNEKWYIKQKNIKDTFMPRPTAYMTQGQMTVTIGSNTPIWIDGKFIGTMGANVLITYLQKLADELDIFQKSGKIIIIHPSGTLLAMTGEKDSVAKDISILAKKYNSSKIINKDNFDNSFIVTHDNMMESLTNFKLNGIDGNWKVGIIVPLAKIYEHSYEVILEQILIGIFLTILAIIVLFIFAKKIAQSILNISELINKSSNSVTVNSESIAKETDSALERINEQASSIEETSASMEELNGMIQNNVRSAEKGSNIAIKISNSTEDTKSKMENLANSMEKITENSKKVEHILQFIENIKEKTAIMDDIVFQTKLLSFNASVEAERAGEHGRGFSVVAQEVGSLAELSGNAAREISEIVQQSIGQSGKIIKETTSLTDEGKGHLANANKSLETILSESSLMRSESQTILEASKEQAIGISQINEAITIIDQAVQDNSRIVANVATSGQNLDGEAKKLYSFIKSLNKLIHDK